MAHFNWKKGLFTEVWPGCRETGRSGTIPAPDLQGQGEWAVPNPGEDSCMGRVTRRELGPSGEGHSWPVVAQQMGSLGIDTLTSLLHLPDFLQVLPIGRTWLKARRQGDLSRLYIQIDSLRRAGWRTWRTPTLNQNLSQESYHFKPVVGHIVNGVSDTAQGGATPAGKHPSHPTSPQLSIHSQDGVLSILNFEMLWGNMTSIEFNLPNPPSSPKYHIGLESSFKRF